MGINWDIVKQRVEVQACAFAEKLGDAPDSTPYKDRYKGFYAGFMHNATELAALRQIVERLDGKKGVELPAIEAQKPELRPYQAEALKAATLPPLPKLASFL